MQKSPKTYESQPLDSTPELGFPASSEAVLVGTRTPSPEFPLLTEVAEATVVFERDGVEVRANLKPGGAEGEPPIIETQLQGEGPPLEDRFSMIVERLTVLSLKGSEQELAAGAVVSPAYIHPVKAESGYKIAIKGRA